MFSFGVPGIVSLKEIMQVYDFNLTEMLILFPVPMKWKYESVFELK